MAAAWRVAPLGSYREASSVVVEATSRYTHIEGHISVRLRERLMRRMRVYRACG